MAAFADETVGVGKKLKTPTEKRTYHAIPEGDAPGDAARTMAFLEMLTGREAEVLHITQEKTQVQEIRRWVSPEKRVTPAPSYSNLDPIEVLQLDYNPTIFCDKANNIRAIRPIIMNDRYKPCPYKEGNSPVKPPPPQKRARKEAAVSHSPGGRRDEVPGAKIVPLEGVSQSFRLLDPTALGSVWAQTDTYTGLSCAYRKGYTCPEGTMTGCDLTVTDDDLLKNGTWIVRLKGVDERTLTVPNYLKTYL